MKYTKQQEQIISDGKIYLRTYRNIKRERFQLLDEYKEEPTPSSLTFQENKGTSISQITRFNEYAVRRELLLKKIELFNQALDPFTLIVLLLPTRQRQIIDTYMEAKSYGEMIDELSEKYFISISTYKRELPEICLYLSQYIDFRNIPSLDEINKQFYEQSKIIKHK